MHVSTCDSLAAILPSAMCDRTVKQIGHSSSAAGGEVRGGKASVSGAGGCGSRALGASSEAIEVALGRLERGSGIYSVSSSSTSASLLLRLLDSVGDLPCKAWAPAGLLGGVVRSARVFLGVLLGAAGDVRMLATGATPVAVPPSSLHFQGCLKLDVIRYNVLSAKSPVWVFHSGNSPCSLCP